MSRHILYAFANLKPDTGEVYLSDLWADQDIHYPGDSWNDPGTNLYGNLKAIYKIKKANRHIKSLLSIGGFTYSPSFNPIVVNASLRSKFVSSAVQLLEDYGFDGIDIDYEYPSNNDQAKGFVSLLQELRAALDEHAKEENANYRFLLTVSYLPAAKSQSLTLARHRLLHLAVLRTTSSSKSLTWTNILTSGT